MYREPFKALYPLFIPLLQQPLLLVLANLADYLVLEVLDDVKMVKYGLNMGAFLLSCKIGLRCIMVIENYGPAEVEGVISI